MSIFVLSMNYKNFNKFFSKTGDFILPGKKAQFMLSPVSRKIIVNKNNPKKASVLIFCYPKNDKMHVILIKRSDYIGFHSGEISFPGGKLEIQDKGDFQKCAYREAYEEIGFETNKAIYLGKLNKYITASGFLIQPIVVLLKEVQNFIINRQEVTSILHFPVNYLLSKDVINKVFIDEDQNKYFLNIYWKKNKIWGATAKILIDLINLLKIKND